MSITKYFQILFLILIKLYYFIGKPSGEAILHSASIAIDW